MSASKEAELYCGAVALDTMRPSSGFETRHRWSDSPSDHGWTTIRLTPDLPGRPIERMVSYPKGVSMDDRSQLAERIVDQVADAVIYASRSGVIIRWNRAS